MAWLPQRMWRKHTTPAGARSWPLCPVQGAPEGAATGSGAGGEVGRLLIKPQTAPYTFWEKMF